MAYKDYGQSVRQQPETAGIKVGGSADSNFVITRGEMEFRGKYVSTETYTENDLIWYTDNKVYVWTDSSNDASSTNVPGTDANWTELSADGDPHSSRFIKVNSGDTDTAATASGTDGIAIGRASAARGENSIAIGDDAQDRDSTSDNAIAIGTSSEADGSKSIAIGYDAEADATASIAIGDDADSRGTDSIAIGRDVKVGSGYSSAVYIGSDIPEQSGTHTETIAIGRAAVSSTSGDVAIGAASTASGTLSVALGRGAESSGGSSTAVGHSAKATASGSDAFGQGAQATGVDSTAIGHDAEVQSQEGIGIGTGVYILGENAVGIGEGNRVYGEDAVSFGGDSILYEDNQISIGEDNRLRGTNAISLGHKTIVGTAIDFTFTSTTFSGTGNVTLAFGGLQIDGAAPSSTNNVAFKDGWKLYLIQQENDPDDDDVNHIGGFIIVDGDQTIDEADDTLTVLAGHGLSSRTTSGELDNLYTAANNSAAIGTNLTVTSPNVMVIGGNDGADTPVQQEVRLAQLTSSSMDSHAVVTKSYVDAIDPGEDNQNAFSRIAVTGQDNLDADSATSTLTVAGGTGITVTTDGDSDTLTITNTVTDTNTTYDLSVPASTTAIRLAGSDSTNDDVTITGEGNVTVTRTSATELTIASTASGGGIDDYSITDAYSAGDLVLFDDLFWENVEALPAATAFANQSAYAVGANVTSDSKRWECIVAVAAQSGSDTNDNPEDDDTNWTLVDPDQTAPGIWKIVGGTITELPPRVYWEEQSGSDHVDIAYFNHLANDDVEIHKKDEQFVDEFIYVERYTDGRWSMTQPGDKTSDGFPVAKDTDFIVVVDNDDGVGTVQVTNDVDLTGIYLDLEDYTVWVFAADKVTYTNVPTDRVYFRHGTKYLISSVYTPSLLETVASAARLDALESDVSHNVYEPVTTTTAVWTYTSDALVPNDGQYSFIVNNNYAAVGGDHRLDFNIDDENAVNTHVSDNISHLAKGHRIRLTHNSVVYRFLITGVEFDPNGGQSIWVLGLDFIDRSDGVTSNPVHTLDDTGATFTDFEVSQPAGPSGFITNDTSDNDQEVFVLRQITDGSEITWNYIGSGSKTIDTGNIQKYSTSKSYEQDDCIFFTDNKVYFWNSGTDSTAGTSPTTAGNSWQVLSENTVDVVSNVATNTILGRNDSGSGDSEELTPAEVRTMLDVAEGATKGIEVTFTNGTDADSTLDLTEATYNDDNHFAFTGIGEYAAYTKAEFRRIFDEGSQGVFLNDFDESPGLSVGNVFSTTVGQSAGFLEITTNVSGLVITVDIEQVASVTAVNDNDGNTGFFFPPGTYTQVGSFSGFPTVSSMRLTADETVDLISTASLVEDLNTIGAARTYGDFVTGARYISKGDSDPANDSDGNAYTIIRPTWDNDTNHFRVFVSGGEEIRSTLNGDALVTRTY